MQPPRVQERTLSLDGYRYPMRVMPGADPADDAILVLGGAYQSMDSWRRFAGDFWPERTIVMADLPGTGAADSLPAHYGVDFFAEAIHQVIRNSGVERVSIVGASYGALSAYRYAQLHPERVRQMALIGFMTSLTDRVRAASEQHLRELDRLGGAEIAAFVIEQLLTPENRERVERAAVVERLLRQQLRRLEGDTLAKHRTNLVRLATQPPLETSRAPEAPSLLFTGEHDHFTTPDRLRTLASRFGEATFTVIRHADHLCHLERPQTVIDLVRRFFDGKTLEDAQGIGPIERFGAARSEAVPHLAAS